MDDYIQNIVDEARKDRNAVQGLIADYLLDPDHTISERTRTLLIVSDQMLETQASAMNCLLARIETLNEE